jgi:hypothetical protein
MFRDDWRGCRDISAIALRKISLRELLSLTMAGLGPATQ